MREPLEFMGWSVMRCIETLGRMTLFSVRILRCFLVPPIRFAAFRGELYKLGVLSLIIICVSGFAVGMVLGVQGYHTLQRFGATSSLGALVGLSLVRELGPVLTGLLTAGRAGSATAAEIATMVATEQMDGLRMMSADPVHVVVAPKALAMAVVMPLLSGLFILSGLFGGYLVGVGFMGGDVGVYVSSLQASVDFSSDILGGILKASVFGILVGLIATYRGFISAPNSAGVSSATTSTVVVSSVTILIFDYIITALWMA